MVVLRSALHNVEYVAVVSARCVCVRVTEWYGFCAMCWVYPYNVWRWFLSHLHSANDHVSYFVARQRQIIGWSATRRSNRAAVVRGREVGTHWWFPNRAHYNFLSREHTCMYAHVTCKESSVRISYPGITTGWLKPCFQFICHLNCKMWKALTRKGCISTS